MQKIGNRLMTNGLYDSLIMLFGNAALTDLLAARQ